MDVEIQDHCSAFNVHNIWLSSSWIYIDFFMESGDVRYLRTSLFSQNERARLCERVSFVKTNECVNIVQKHFP